MRKYLYHRKMLFLNLVKFTCILHVYFIFYLNYVYKVFNLLLNSVSVFEFRDNYNYRYYLCRSL